MRYSGLEYRLPLRGPKLTPGAADSGPHPGQRASQLTANYHEV